MNPSVSPCFTLAPGEGDLPKVTLVAPDGARAEIYLHGAHVSSWSPADGSERLFMSRISAFRTGSPIRGGVPLVFPQFGAMGPLPQHGFARLQSWELAAAEVVGATSTATFRLVDSAASREMWDHAFEARLEVAVGGNGLAMALTVLNTGNESFSFTTALHTYLAIPDLAATYVQGLAGLAYRDNAAGIDAQQVDPLIRFDGEVNRIYFNAPPEVTLFDGARTMLIRSAGFTDAVVWNPAAAKCAAMPDLEPADYLRFVCVEGATVGKPVTLAPGERWLGSQSLVV